MDVSTPLPSPSLCLAPVKSRLAIWDCPTAGEKVTGGSVTLPSFALPCLQGEAAHSLQPSNHRWEASLRPHRLGEPLEGPLYHLTSPHDRLGAVGAAS